MKLMQWTFLSMLFSASLIAQDIKIVGSIDQPITLPQMTTLTSTVKEIKHISLLKIELSDTARQKIEKRAENVLTPSVTASASTVKQTQLGMNNVPVLDQGGFGSCVTFASTAAVDAVLGKGDYISQLCLLQLGRYLEKLAYMPSGWDGSLGSIVLNQMTMFGFINKNKQTSNGCGGLTNYPAGGNIGTEMSPEDYHQLSERMDDNIVAWTPILDVYDIFIDKVNLNATVERVKAVLNAGDRLTFGVLLPGTDRGVVGAVGKHHSNLDSWVLTPEIVADMQSQADLPGHEMIITGYDNDAIAIDDHGRTHKGLFTLRNSWGTRAGDNGNFYMSYDYFKALAIEVQRIRHIS